MAEGVVEGEGIEVLLEIEVVVGGFEATLEVDVEAWRVGELLNVYVFREIKVVRAGDVFEAVGANSVEVVVLDVMFAIASIICILRKLASTTSFIMSSTLQALRIFSSSPLSRSIF